MYCNLKKYTLYLIFVMIYIRANGQDSHLSQYYSLPMSVNPAQTGIFEGDYRISGIYRNQWSSITSPFATTVGAFDMPLKYIDNVGLGIYIRNSTAGAGHINTFNALTSVGYHFSLDPGEINHLAIGFQGGFIQKRFDPTKLTFEKQYVPGSGFDSNASNGEDFLKTQLTNFDLNVGVMWYYGNNVLDSKFQPYLGYAILHITKPDESFYSAISHNYPRRNIIHGGSRINMHETIHITPHLLVMTQGPFLEFTGGVNSNYTLEEGTELLFGLAYRNRDALITQTGIRFKDFTVGLSYDINTSSLNKVSNGQGGFEISLVYVKRTIDTDGDGIVDAKDMCPVIPGLPVYNGCPDSDGDGIKDSEDDCPLEPGEKSSRGCPLQVKSEGIRTDTVTIEKVRIEKQILVIPPQEQKILNKVFKNLAFEYNKAVIKPVSFGYLDELYEMLKNKPDYKLHIAGHTDNEGSEYDNFVLGQQRGDAVKEYLIKKGIDADRITAISFGEKMPIADNSTKRGKSMNRRVEFTIYKSLKSVSF
ncbi:PorP/SprF family type IX secretion system membrane protein [Candidatus Amoebophilus asiaticus]|nr:PorP/SprF family type IX secretion system membrane protein [Candidatus Amoebophilus asiaticus]